MSSNATLGGVAATSAASAWAVGSYPAFARRTLILHYP